MLRHQGPSFPFAKEGELMPSPLLEVHKIVKEFPGVKALQGVAFDLLPGEIHALVGENGAGKSTLMKILSGYYPYGSYEGELSFEGKTCHFHKIKDSERAGIVIIHQELALVQKLSLGENIFLGQECTRGFGIIDWDQCWTRAQELLERVGLKHKPQRLLKDCSVGEQQLVEIAKSLARNAKVLILDEPTAALTEEESLRLLSILRQLRKEGVSCIYISHRLHEVLAIADRITVLRDGQTVGTYPRAELNEDQMVALMVGRELHDRYPRQTRERGAKVLNVKDWTVLAPDQRLTCQNINFSAFKGEILGVSGLMGSGRSELFMNLLGLWGKTRSGTLELDGQPQRFRSPQDAIEKGMALVSEDRKRYGLVLGMNITENTSLASLSRLTRWGAIDAETEIQKAQAFRQELKIKSSSLEQPVGNLSGGNQQKVVLAKWLLTEPKVLILDEPTRGIDVGARYEIYKIMNELVARGVVVIMISSDLSEVIGMSDRILVFHEGRIAGEVMAAEATQERIMAMATGTLASPSTH